MPLRSLKSRCLFPSFRHLPRTNVVTSETRLAMVCPGSLVRGILNVQEVRLYVWQRWVQREDLGKLGNISSGAELEIDT